MSKLAIVYGSTTGNTAEVAKQLQNTWGKNVADLYEVGSASASQLNSYPFLILGTSTWGCGDLQDDWECHLNLLSELDLKGKKVALFGVGDQLSYPDTYLNGMGTLYEHLTQTGAIVVGFWPTEGYEFTESTAVRDHSFVGLALDEDNQSSLRETRIAQWVTQLHSFLE